jgi:acetylornithine deacetylase/succinyl-diaminopimelate desuccinylase-like protein
MKTGEDTPQQHRPSGEWREKRRKGFLLFSHADTANSNEASCTQSPLGKTRRDGLILGRGALDCKSPVALHWRCAPE